MLDSLESGIRIDTVLNNLPEKSSVVFDPVRDLPVLAKTNRLRHIKNLLENGYTPGDDAYKLSLALEPAADALLLYPQERAFFTEEKFHLLNKCIEHAFYLLKPGYMVFMNYEKIYDKFKVIAPLRTLFPDFVKGVIDIYTSDEERAVFEKKMDQNINEEKYSDFVSLLSRYNQAFPNNASEYKKKLLTRFSYEELLSKMNYLYPEEFIDITYAFPENYHTNPSVLSEFKTQAEKITENAKNNEFLQGFHKYVIPLRIATADNVIVNERGVQLLFGERPQPQRPLERKF